VQVSHIHCPLFLLSLLAGVRETNLVGTCYYFWKGISPLALALDYGFDDTRVVRAQIYCFNPPSVLPLLWGKMFGQNHTEAIPHSSIPQRFKEGKRSCIQLRHLHNFQGFSQVWTEGEILEGVAQAEDGLYSVRGTGKN